VPQGRYTLAFLAAPGGEDAQVELTYNWDPEAYGEGRNFGHLAYEVDDIYAACQTLMDKGVTINRPPRDGRMAFVRSPDNISIELLQSAGAAPGRALGVDAQHREVVGAIRRENRVQAFAKGGVGERDVELRLDPAVVDPLVVGPNSRAIGDSTASSNGFSGGGSIFISAQA